MSNELDFFSTFMGDPRYAWFKEQILRKMLETYQVRQTIEEDFLVIHKGEETMSIPSEVFKNIIPLLDGAPSLLNHIEHQWAKDLLVLFYGPGKLPGMRVVNENSGEYFFKVTNIGNIYHD